MVSAFGPPMRTSPCASMTHVDVRLPSCGPRPTTKACSSRPCGTTDISPTRSLDSVAAVMLHRLDGTQLLEMLEERAQVLCNARPRGAQKARLLAPLTNCHVVSNAIG